jgi:hypothetical protein
VRGAVGGVNTTQAGPVGGQIDAENGPGSNVRAFSFIDIAKICRVL